MTQKHRNRGKTRNRGGVVKYPQTPWLEDMPVDYQKQRFYTGNEVWVDLTFRITGGEHARRGETRRYVVFFRGEALTSFPDGLAGRRSSLTLAKRLDHILEL